MNSINGEHTKTSRAVEEESIEASITIKIETVVEEIKNESLSVSPDTDQGFKNEFLSTTSKASQDLAVANMEKTSDCFPIWQKDTTLMGINQIKNIVKSETTFTSPENSMGFIDISPLEEAIDVKPSLEIKSEESVTSSGSTLQQMISQQELGGLASIPTEEYVCEFCSSVFACDKMLGLHVGVCTMRSEVLKDHMTKHMGKKPLVCNVCNKTFAHASHYKSHLRTHTGEKPYACNFCEKAFTSTSNLNRHTQIHTGEKPHKCNTCNLAFRDSGGLKIHQRTHTGERPYVCIICNRAFNRTQTLKAHMVTHVRAAKPHICTFCNKAFSSIWKLREHVTCNICNQGFCAE